MTAVSVVVPWRADGGPRDRAFAWIRRWYAAHWPAWEMVIERQADTGAWRKAALVNAGAARARGTVLVLADADCLVDPAALTTAVARARTGAPWVVPHRTVYRLSATQTAALLAQAPGVPLPPPDPAHGARPPYAGLAGGGLVVLRRDRFLDVGGMDPRFVGWGGEDEALASLLDTCLGRHVRLDAHLLHCWHPDGPRLNDPHHRENRRLAARYALCYGEPDRMQALVAERGGVTPDPLGGSPGGGRCRMMRCTQSPHGPRSPQA